MSHYTIPTPNQYMKTKTAEFFMQRGQGNESVARRIHEDMEIFADAMNKLIDYHKQRTGEGR